MTEPPYMHELGSHPCRACKHERDELRATVEALRGALRRLVDELPLTGNVEWPGENIDWSRLRDAQASARVALLGTPTKAGAQVE